MGGDHREVPSSQIIHKGIAGSRQRFIAASSARTKLRVVRPNGARTKARGSAGPADNRDTARW